MVSCFMCSYCRISGTAWNGTEEEIMPLIDAERLLHSAATGHGMDKVKIFGFPHSPYGTAELLKH